MGRAGSGGSIRTSSGGNSAGRASGGHRVGTSSSSTRRAVGTSSGGNSTRRASGGHRVGTSSSSTRRASGGHRVGASSSSRRRASGGHRVGASNSSRKHTGSGTVSRGSRGGIFGGGSSTPRGGIGMPPPPPPPRRIRPRMSFSRSRYMGAEMSPLVGVSGGRPSYRGGGCLTTIVLFFVIISAILTIQKLNSATSSSSTQTSIIEREKLDTNNAYINDCIIDELRWFDNVSKTGKQLKNFWRKTGVQPYIILRDYDAELTSDSEKKQWAVDYYDENFSTENIFLFVYFAEEDTDNDVGYMVYANGYQTSSVMDLEAVDIFWDNIDKYWYTDLSTDDVIVNAFNDTADAIMHASSTGKDTFKLLFIIIVTILLIIIIINLVKKKNRQVKETLEEE